MKELTTEEMMDNVNFHLNRIRRGIEAPESISADEKEEFLKDFEDWYNAGEIEEADYKRVKLYFRNKNMN